MDRLNAEMADSNAKIPASIRLVSTFSVACNLDSTAVLFSPTKISMLLIDDATAAFMCCKFDFMASTDVLFAFNPSSNDVKRLCDCDACVSKLDCI